MRSALMLGTILAGCVEQPQQYADLDTEEALPAAGGQPMAVDAVPPAFFVADFVSTAASGTDLNDSGEVIGTSYAENGCGPFCLPQLETVVWSGLDRYVLPELPGFSGIYVTGIDPAGWGVGLAGLPGTLTRAVAWEPVLNGYQIIDLGLLPGTTLASAAGIDDLGRVVGWSTTLNFPPTGSPFVWTAAGGLQDLSAQGFPDEAPLAISPNGMVATANYWYSLDDPASVVQVPPPPAGFLITSSPAVINDSGEQARFLVSTSAGNLSYPYRLHVDGTWHQISAIGGGALSPFGLGSIDAAGTVTATVLGSGMVAWGPDGELTPLTDLLSPAWGGAGVLWGGPSNEVGQILAEVMVGASARLVTLTPAEPCTSSCLQVPTLQLLAQFVQDPANPGQCFPNGVAYNRARAKVAVTDEAGVALAGVEVFGRFMDDYWMSDPVAATTNANGIAKFKMTGSCGTGTLAFQVEDVVVAGRTFDRTTGVLTAAMIPQ